MKIELIHFSHTTNKKKISRDHARYFLEGYRLLKSDLKQYFWNVYRSLISKIIK